MTSRLSTLLFAVTALTLLACPGPGPTPPPPDAGEVPVDAGQQVPTDGGQEQPTDGGMQDPPDAGAALLHLEGPIDLAPNLTLPSDLRVGMLWFAGVDPRSPSSPRASVSGPRLGSPPSTRWRLDVHADPPPEARSQFQSPAGGAGTYAVGALVIYRDADGDGALTVNADGSSSDQLVGSSAGAMPFDLEVDQRHTLVIWREGEIGADETGFVQGFNLVTLDQPFARPTRVPNTSEVILRPTLEPRLQLMFCPPAFASPTPEFACGQRVYRAPQITAMLMQVEQFGVIANIEVIAGERRLTDAQVLLNGVAIPPDADGHYLLMELSPLVIQPGVNQLRVEAGDFDPVALEVVLPAVPTLHTPSPGGTLPTASSVTVAWQPVTGATTYDVSLFPDSGAGSVYETTTESHLDLTTPATAGPATLSISVMAEGSVGRHLSLGTSSLSVPVVLVTP